MIDHSLEESKTFDFSFRSALVTEGGEPCMDWTLISQRGSH